VEAHVRLYAITAVPAERRDDPLGRWMTYETSAMRVASPDDSQGAQLLLCLPQVVAHEINRASPLHPRARGESDASRVISLISLAGLFAPQNSYADASSSSPSTGCDGSEAIRAHMRARGVEVVALVEGVDQSTGGAVQARHSYLPEEVVWVSAAPCHHHHIAHHSLLT